MISVIIPADEGRRDALLAVVKGYIGSVLPDAEIIVSRGSIGPYCKSEVCNRGAREATGDILIFHDSDMLHHPDTLRRAAEVETWGVPTGEVRNFKQDGSWKKRPGKIHGRGGLFAFTREALIEWDEGFIGWGHEDEALYFVATQVIGPAEDLGLDPSYHLYHEPQPKSTANRLRWHKLKTPERKRHR